MNYRKIVSAVALLWCTAGFAAGSEPAACVRPMMGTGAAGCVVPVAAAPFGMVQLGPDTYFTASGYHYDHPLIYGFSHTHKSGGGGTDYQDIMFFPCPRKFPAGTPNKLAIVIPIIIIATAEVLFPFSAKRLATIEPTPK